MISQNHKQGWRNPWLLGLLAVVLAGVLINARMLWNVVHHPVRVLDNNYSVKGHNQHDAKWVTQQAERSTLGWQAKLNSPNRLANDPLADPSASRFILLTNDVELNFELNDKDGHPIQGAQVSIGAEWPGNPDFDTRNELHEISPGHYQGNLKFSRPGNWDLLIKAVHEGRSFEMEQKVYAVFEKQP